MSVETDYFQSASQLVTLVETEIERQGPILVVQQIDRQSADKVAEQVSLLGLSTKITTSSVN